MRSLNQAVARPAAARTTPAAGRPVDLMAVLKVLIAEEKAAQRPQAFAARRASRAGSRVRPRRG
jgi:hypothetical protein